MEQSFIFNKVLFKQYHTRYFNSPNFYCRKGFKDIYTSLCRYTCERNLDDLVNGCWRVNRRQSFSDKYEFGEFPLPFQVWLDEENTKNYNETYQRIQQSIRETELIPAICLTKWDKWDKYFFWKTYTDNNGICIVFSMENFVKAISNSKFDFFMSKMEYNDPFKNPNYDTIPFSKTPSYTPEKEYRIYLQNKNGTAIEGDQPIYIKIDFEILNPVIIISPFSDYSNKYSELIKKYPCLKGHLKKSKLIETTNHK